MAINKTQLPPECTPQTVTSLVGAKTIRAAYAYKHGSVMVIELDFSDASANFIKVGAGRTLEIGGTCEMDSGTKVFW